MGGSWMARASDRPGHFRLTVSKVAYPGGSDSSRALILADHRTTGPTSRPRRLSTGWDARRTLGDPRSDSGPGFLARRFLHRVTSGPPPYPEGLRLSSGGEASCGRIGPFG